MSDRYDRAWRERKHVMLDNKGFPEVQIARPARESDEEYRQRIETIKEWLIARSGLSVHERLSEGYIEFDDLL
jgi:hypothetical protein